MCFIVEIRLFICTINSSLYITAVQSYAKKVFSGSLCNSKCPSCYLQIFFVNIKGEKHFLSTKDTYDKLPDLNKWETCGYLWSKSCRQLHQCHCLYSQLYQIGMKALKKLTEHYLSNTKSLAAEKLGHELVDTQNITKKKVNTANN